MIDKYKILNNEKINFSKYDIVNTDDEKMKNIVISKLNSRKKKHKNPFKIAMTSIASIILCVTTVYAGQYISSKINVNNTELPELDPMKVISVNNIDGEVDEELHIYVSMH